MCLSAEHFPVIPWSATSCSEADAHVPDPSANDTSTGTHDERDVEVAGHGRQAQQREWGSSAAAGRCLLESGQLRLPACPTAGPQQRLQRQHLSCKQGTRPASFMPECTQWQRLPALYVHSGSHELLCMSMSLWNLAGPGLEPNSVCSKASQHQHAGACAMMACNLQHNLLDGLSFDLGVHNHVKATFS